MVRKSKIEKGGNLCNALIGIGYGGIMFKVEGGEGGGGGGMEVRIQIKE